MSHKCPAPTCSATVATSQLACRGHWYALPAELRSRIWAAYKGQSDEDHSALVAEASDYLHERYPT
jgi:hypothetical protein